MRIQDRHRDQGVEVLAVDVWPEDPEKVRSFVKEKGINYTVLLNGQDVAEAYGVEGIPTSFVIDRGGLTVSRQVGLESEAALEARIKAAR